MKVIVLSSGSKGNTTFIESKNTKILIDIGNTCKYVTEKLKGIGIEPEKIDGILLTHTHIDHVKGLKVFQNKYNTKIYFSNKMKEELEYINTNYELIEEGIIKLKDLTINIIKTSHDTNESFGYIIESNDKSIVYITDTGYINNKYFNLLSNKNLYILESNHDIEMLNNGPYPFKIRQRILGDKGHLSNYDCSKYLSNFIGNNTKCIMLAHLSQDNNTPNIAYNTLIERLNNTNHNVEKIIILKQDICSEEVLI